MADIKKYITKENVTKAVKMGLNVIIGIYAPRRAPNILDIWGVSSGDDFYSNERRKAELKADAQKREDEMKAREQAFRHEKEMLELKLRAKEAGFTTEKENTHEA